MSVPAVVHRGIREIKMMLQKYQTLDMQIPANVRIQPTLGHRKGVEVIFDNTEDHTLGNLLQTYLVERHIMADQAPRLTYAGYKMGHPLKKELTIEIGSEADMEMTARRAIVAVIRFLLGLLDTMERDWLTITGTAAQLPALPPVPAAAAADEGILPPVPEPTGLATRAAPTATRGRGRGRGGRGGL
jgi:DNA-directed RNA polymerase subunit L